MDQSPISQNRKSRRSSVFLAAALEAGGRSIPVKLRNLSSEGALVEAKGLPIEGTDVVFRRSELEVPGRVVWVSGNHAGVAFKAHLEPEQVLRHIPSPPPRAKPDYRRPRITGHELTREEQGMVRSLAWAKRPARDIPGE